MKLQELIKSTRWLIYREKGASKKCYIRAWCDLVGDGLWIRESSLNFKEENGGNAYSGFVIFSFVQFLFYFWSRDNHVQLIKISQSRSLLPFPSYMALTCLVRPSLLYYLIMPVWCVHHNPKLAKFGHPMTQKVVFNQGITLEFLGIVVWVNNPKAGFNES